MKVKTSPQPAASYHSINGYLRSRCRTLADWNTSDDLLTHVAMEWMLRILFAVALLMGTEISSADAGSFSPPSLHGPAATLAIQASHRCRHCCGCDRMIESPYYYRPRVYHLRRNRSGVMYYGPARMYRPNPSVVEYRVRPPQRFYYTYSREPFYDRIW